jgi:hypothetical protein
MPEAISQRLSGFFLEYWIGRVHPAIEESRHTAPYPNLPTGIHSPIARPVNHAQLLLGVAHGKFSPSPSDENQHSQSHFVDAMMLIRGRMGQ